MSRLPALLLLALALALACEPPPAAPELRLAGELSWDRLVSVEVLLGDGQPPQVLPVQRYQPKQRELRLPFAPPEGTERVYIGTFDVLGCLLATGSGAPGDVITLSAARDLLTKDRCARPALTSLSPERARTLDEATLTIEGFGLRPGDVLRLGARIDAPLTVESPLRATARLPKAEGLVGEAAVELRRPGAAPLPLSRTFRFMLSEITLAKSQSLSAGAGPQVLAAGDFDGNGLMDLAWGALGTQQLELAFDYKVSGDAGAFASRAVVDLGPSIDHAAIGIAAADLDGRGGADLVVLTAKATLCVLLSPRPTDLKPSCAPVPVAIRSVPVVGRRVAIAQLVGDERPDVAILGDGNSDRQLLVLQNVGGGQLRPVPSPVLMMLNPRTVTTADIDRDGQLDLLVSGEDTALLRIFYNRGGAFPVNAEDRNIYQKLGPTGTVCGAVAAGHVDEDDKIDLATACNSSRPNAAVLYLMPDAAARPPPLTIAAGDTPEDVAFADLDGDGRDEVLLADSNYYSVTANLRRELRVYRQDPAGGQLAQLLTPAVDEPQGGLFQMLVTDLDRDGRLDVVLGNRSQALFSVFRNVSR